MKKHLLLTIILSTLSLNLHANPVIPNQCPSLESLQAQSLTNLQYSSHWKLWFGFQAQSKYNTNVEWQFTASIPADDKDAATLKFGQAMKDLRLQLGPFVVDEAYMCIYGSDVEPQLQAVAYKPGIIDPFENKAFFKRK